MSRTRTLGWVVISMVLAAGTAVGLSPAHALVNKDGCSQTAGGSTPSNGDDRSICCAGHTILVGEGADAYCADTGTEACGVYISCPVGDSGWGWGDSGGSGAGSGGGQGRGCGYCESDYERCAAKVATNAEWCVTKWAQDHAADMCSIPLSVNGQPTRKAGVHYRKCACQNGDRGTLGPKQNLPGLGEQCIDQVQTEVCWTVYGDPDNCIDGWLYGVPGSSTTTTTGSTVTIPSNGGSSGGNTSTGQTVSFSPQTGLAQSCASASLVQSGTCNVTRSICLANAGCD